MVGEGYNASSARLSLPYLVPPAEPHGEHGAVLDDDGERRREDDLGRDEEEARPRVAPHLVLLQVAVPVAEQTRGAEKPEAEVEQDSLGGDTIGLKNCQKCPQKFMKSQIEKDACINFKSYNTEQSES